MGAVISNIYFEKGIPDFNSIKKEFFQVTGLYLELNASLGLTKQIKSNSEIIDCLNADLKEVERLERIVGKLSEYRHLIDFTYPYLRDKQQLPPDFLSESSVTNRLEISVEELNEIKKIDESQQITTLQEKLDTLNLIQYLTFDAPEFYQIMVAFDDRLIHLHYFVGQFYFPYSLEKTLLNLGGLFVDREGRQTEDEFIKKKLKKLNKLNHWKSYFWFNRPRR